MDRHVKRFAGCSKENTTTENSDVTDGLNSVLNDLEGNV